MFSPSDSLILTSEYLSDDCMKSVASRVIEVKSKIRPVSVSAALEKEAGNAGVEDRLTKPEKESAEEIAPNSTK